MKQFILKHLQLIIIIGLIIVVFMQRGCKNNNMLIKSDNIIEYDTIIKPIELPSKIITKYKTIKGDIIYLPGKVDTIVLNKFSESEDTVKIRMFSNAIKIRQYNQLFSDSLADVSIFAETKGELLKLAPKVTIKARLPEKKSIFAIYAGGCLYFNKNIDLGYKLNLRVQNKKGDLISGAYDPINKVIFAEYDFRIINIKK